MTGLLLLAALPVTVAFVLIAILIERRIDHD